MAEVTEFENPDLPELTPQPGKRNSGRNGGRKPIDIDWENFDKLCLLQCTIYEIAGFFEVDVDTIRKAVKREHKTDFSTYWRRKAAQGTISLRRKQLQRALEGSDTMLIWLGKSWLGQGEYKTNDPDPENTHGDATEISQESYGVTFLGTEEDEDTLKNIE